MSETPFVHTICTPRGFYFYDVNTNQIVRVKEPVYRYLERVEQTQTVEEPEPEIGRYLERLKKRGLLKTKRPSVMEHPELDSVEYTLTNGMENVTLQLTQQCNFRCSYCAYACGEFEFQRNHSPKKMSWETAQKAIDFYAEHSKDKRQVGFGFYGGEPLMEFELLKRATLYFEKVMKGKDIIFNITTNGTLLTDEVMSFFQEHNFSVLLSLDGTPEAHNRSRRFLANGMGTFSAVEKNVRRMQERYPELFKTILVNAVMDPRYSPEKLYAWFSKHDLFSQIIVQNILIDDLFSVERAIISDEYRIGDYMGLLKAYMVLLGRAPADSVTKMEMVNLKRTISTFANHMGVREELPDRCSHGGPCVPGKTRLLVDVDGGFFPCEKVSENSETMKIGSVDTGFDFEKIKTLMNIVSLTKEQCKNCWALVYCTQCARRCDNCGELSAEMKESQCEQVRRSTDENLRDFIFTQEFGIDIEAKEA